MLEILLLVTALSIDMLMASVAYGSSKIKIPIGSVIALTTISSLALLLSILLGNTISIVLPATFAKGFSFSVLFLLGMSRFLEGVLKEFLKKHTQKGQPLLFKFLDFHFIVEVYTDHTKADKDKSKILSVKEALTLGLVLSLDGIAAGVGSGLLLMGNVKIFILSFMIGFLAIKAGVRLGEKISKIGNFEVSWLSGVLLMVIAFLRLQIF